MLLTANLSGCLKYCDIQNMEMAETLVALVLEGTLEGLIFAHLPGSPFPRVLNSWLCNFGNKIPAFVTFAPLLAPS